MKQNAPSPGNALSLDLLAANIGSLPGRKSEELLSREEAITVAPENITAYMVESQTKAKPHFVKINKNSKVTFDDCPAFASVKVCAHAIAVAERAGLLSSYVK